MKKFFFFLVVAPMLLAAVGLVFGTTIKARSRTPMECDWDMVSVVAWRTLSEIKEIRVCKCFGSSQTHFMPDRVCQKITGGSNE